MSQQDAPPDIVVVEDNEDEARMTMMALHRLHPRLLVVVIPDGEQAVARLTGVGALHPKLIFLDLKVPKVHGLQVLASLKSQPCSRKIPVVVLTSSDLPNDIDQARTLGCDEYLCKPVDWEQYVHVVSLIASRYLDFGAE